MIVNEQDIESLEMYLDHELCESDARALDERLFNDTHLQKALGRLRSHRELRLSAMSGSIDTDAAAIERLVASVRGAQADETMSKASQSLAFRRKASPIRSIFSAAACVGFGLLLGVAIQRQHAPDGLVATPSFNSTSSLMGAVGNGGMEAHGAYVVSLINSNGREMMKVRFPTEETARQFMANVNSRTGPVRTLDVNNATVLQEEPY